LPLKKVAIVNAKSASPSIYLLDAAVVDPLPLSHFSSSELHALESKSLPAMIAKCGFNRNTSRKVLYGPSRLNGGGFRPFATEEGVGQIQYLLKHWTSTLDIGTAQRIPVAWAQMHTGVGWSVFLDVETPLPQFRESHWLRSLRSFLKSINGSIRLYHTYIPPLQHQHDSYIMDHVLSSGFFKEAEIRCINYCRLYLQAVTVSDITDATGTRLFHGVTRGSVEDILSTTKWHLTYQAKPNSASWKLWTKACTLFATSGVLHTTLMTWLYSALDQRRQWAFYYDPSSDMLFHYTSGVYDCHVRWRNQTFGFVSTSSIVALPPLAYPVGMRKKMTGWQIARYNTIRLPPSSPVSTTFQEYCEHLEYWEQILLHNVVLLFSPEETMRQLENSPFRACSDGSATAQQGTFG
jgi:hypothetical protein